MMPLKLLKKLFDKKTPSRFDTLPAGQRRSVELLLERLRRERLTYVGIKKLKNLSWAAIEVRDKGVPGDFIEAGVAWGGTAILLGTLKPKAAPLKLYDVFGLIPPPGAADGEDAHVRFQTIEQGKAVGIEGDEYYGYKEGLEGVVRENLRKHGLTEAVDKVEFIKGLYSETMNITSPVALAHIDCDWYDSVKICIDRIYPRLSVNGIAVFDDYKSYSGCRKAVDEFLAAEATAEVLFHDKSIGIKRVTRPSSEKR
jgi:asparagine synthase (glutamine-hydrolysing)